MKKAPTAKKPALGSGARFKALTQQVGSPALAAWIGRNKYGKTKFQQLAAKGRKNKSKKSKSRK
jgi:hypothetical protein